MQMIELTEDVEAILRDIEAGHRYESKYAELGYAVYMLWVGHKAA